MNNRMLERRCFLEEKGWNDWEIVNLAGDASPRKYFRLSSSNKTAVLMDAPIGCCGPLDPFIEISDYLIEQGFSSPKILAKDTAGGFLIIEDLGDDLFSSLLIRQPEMEYEIYQVALEILVALRQKVPPPHVPTYTPEIQGELSALSLTWYTRYIAGVEVNDREIKRLSDLVGGAIYGLNERQVFIHRDYHAENLLWLPERSDQERIGLIDFQDGSIGQSSYDLVSLLEDARREISTTLKDDLLCRYSELTGDSIAMVKKGVAISGIQRNLRILGVFARLSIRDSKSWYLDYIPRVWDYLMGDLETAGLPDLTSFIMNNLPPPTPENLDKLRSAKIKPHSAMIFAAGFGTRLGNLVKDDPKPLIKVGNTTLLDHALDVTREAGISNIVVNAHYLSHRIVDHLASHSSIRVIIEEPDILDTGGGLLNALPHLGTEPVFTLNSDNYWFDKNPLSLLADYWNGQEMDALLVLGIRKNAFGYKGRGDFVIDTGGHLIRRSGQDTGLVYLGAQLIKPSVIDSVFGSVFSLNAIWDRLIHKKRIKGLLYDGKWAVIDTPHGIETIRKIL